MRRGEKVVVFTENYEYILWQGKGVNGKQQFHMIFKEGEGRSARRN